MKLNEKIAYYRRERRLSQEELAARVGVSRQAVSKWELGEALPDIGKLPALAEAFGVTTDHLLSDSQEPERPEPGQQPVSDRSREETPPASSAESSFDKAIGLAGRLIRRYGWLLGVRVALGGLGVTVIGALARWGFSSMFGAAGNMMGGMGGFGGMDGVSFSPGTPPEVQREILNQLGITPAASPFGGVESFFLGFASVILVLGVLTMLAGGVLAAVLYQRRNRRP